MIVGCGLAFSAVGGWILTAGGARLQLRFRQRLAVALETHVARLQATAAGIEQHERPAVLDRLAILRDQVFTLDRIFLSVFGLLGLLLRLVVIMVILATVAPVMLLLILGTEAPSAKELSVAGATRTVAEARDRAWQAFLGPMERARVRSALVLTAAWAVFAGAFVPVIVQVVNSSVPDRAADTLIVIAAGARLTAYISAAATQIDAWGLFIQGSQRLLWMERFVESRKRGTDADVADKLRDGISLHGVSFRYPGSKTVVINQVDLDLRAGSVVAVV
ncbi:MAG: ATP-binding cassette subfamily B protein [Candidatus Poriferisodalaceae bacterium]